MTNPLTRAILAVEIALANDASPEAIVRAVMEAMMDPSEGMVEAALSPLDLANAELKENLGVEPGAVNCLKQRAARRWQAMLRAAMDENVEG